MTNERQVEQLMIDEVFKAAGGRDSKHRLFATARAAKCPAKRRAAITTACEVDAR